MKKLALLAVLALPLAFTPAQAMDCDATFGKMTAEIAKKSASASKKASLTRMAVAAYDSCKDGDKSFAEKIFEMIMREGN